MNTTNTRQLTENLHTIAQIKSDGHRIITKKGDDNLTTKRGNTYTEWVEVETGFYKPVNAYVRD